jgi:hypothetical protein
VYRPFRIDGTSDFVIATSAAGESVLYAQSPAKDCSGAVTADGVTLLATQSPSGGCAVEDIFFQTRR